MPIYTFQCIKCAHTFEILSSYNNYDSQKIKCPECNSKKVERQYQTDLQNMRGNVIKSDDEIKIGDLANRNRDRMSDDQKANLYHKHNSYKDTAFQRPMPKGSTKIKKGFKTKWT